MSAFTVEVLKSALASKGIKVPSNAKKNTYVKLYKEHVAPLHNIQIHDKYNQFSSDDEDISYITKSKITARMSDNSIEDLDVSNLPDEDLYQRLSTLGVTVGPIVDSTRKIYQKKLIRLMGGDVADSFNGEVTNEDEYSDQDSEPEEISSGKQGSPSGKTLRSSFTSSHSSSSLRQRESTKDKKYVGSSNLDNSLSFDHDRHTPSPRPSLRTVTSTTSSKTTKYVTPTGNIRETQTTRYTFQTSPKKDEAATERATYITRLVVKLFFILLLIAILFASYQYMYSENPLKGLENLAKQALDSANEGGKRATKTSNKS